MFRFKPSLKISISWSSFALLLLCPHLSLRRSFPLAPFAQPCPVPKVQRMKKEGKLQPGNTVPRNTCPLCFGIIAVSQLKAFLGGICVKGLPVCGASSLGCSHPLSMLCSGNVQLCFPTALTVWTLALLAAQPFQTLFLHGEAVPRARIGSGFSRNTSLPRQPSGFPD